MQTQKSRGNRLLATSKTAAVVRGSSASLSICDKSSRLFAGCFSSALASAASSFSFGSESADDRSNWSRIELRQGSGSAARATSTSRRQVSTFSLVRRTRHHSSMAAAISGVIGWPASFAPAALGSTRSRSRP